MRRPSSGPAHYGRQARVDLRKSSSWLWMLQRRIRGPTSANCHEAPTLPCGMRSGPAEDEQIVRQAVRVTEFKSMSLGSVVAG